MTEDERKDMIDPYAVLEVAADASSAEIRLAYLRKVREYPPERDAEGFKRVREAYETLRSPRKRAELTLLELRQGGVDFALDRLSDVPLPPFPERWAEHLLAAVLADLDATIDADAWQARETPASVGSGRPDSGERRPQ